MKFCQKKRLKSLNVLKVVQQIPFIYVMKDISALIGPIDKLEALYEVKLFEIHQHY